jgi:NADPH2:quinone reductase
MRALICRAWGEVEDLTVLRWYHQGKLRPSISHRLPLDRSVEAIRLLTDRKALGKVVVPNGG